MSAITSTAPAEARQAKRRKSGSKFPNGFWGLIGIVIFLGIWELVPALGIVEAAYLPPASEVLLTLFADLALTAFWVAVGETMLAWFIGLAAAVLLALVLGLVIGMSSFLRRATNSTIEFLRPIPSVALIPLAVLLFGTKIESSLMLIIYACFWQVLIQVLYGVADVDNVAMQTARSYGFSRIQRIRDVIFPTMLPYLMTGIRLGAAVALILAITAELIIGAPGLGKEIQLAQSGGAIAGMYALIVATGLLGVAINLCMRIIEKRVLSWHASVRGENAA
ncbi:ABC transporter permease [Glutamicibacter arilaitensis]|jgi:ABC-type nitrate/sulfonate/bicarbonate transport system permease component|uniref:ABC transporter permease n=1 Tax=Glutamicibacter arilaitensis TaxID=256701 RepID=A0A2N7RZW9_9MICC|nr:MULTISPECIES: ABC transporter permease [Glutamicibacter]PMQ19435.1 ABC transporter permease [Glutamicibacter arilaitensis]HCJ54155.1 ABC transporter permease [Glutamicibacter sp.]